MCVCAKFDQFLPARSHFDSKRPKNVVRIATFPSATFGSLFAFHCPLFFTKNNNLEWKIVTLRHSRCFRSECWEFYRRCRHRITLTARWRYSTRCRAVVMSKSRPDVSKITHGFFITINGDTGSCFNSTRGPTGFFSATHGLLVS